MASPYNNRRNLEALKRSNQQRIDEQNRRLNLSISGAEKLGVSGGDVIRDFKSWEVVDTAEQEKVKKRKPVDRGYTVRSAPTTNPEKPRAIKMAYSRDSQTLVIKFRGPKDDIYSGPWIAYDDVPLTMWTQLKASNSTGRYLRYSGLDSYPWYEFNPSDMPEEVRVLFNS